MTQLKGHPLYDTPSLTQSSPASYKQKKPASDNQALSLDSAHGTV